jgi:glycosyltransferase involved in cell wall biosynthesis
VSKAAITVLLPTFNAESTIAAAIESILRQTFRDFELLLIDDASTDRTAELIQTYKDPRIRCVQNQQNLGITRSLNHGIGLTATPWIARMDADDIALPRRLERQMRAVARHPRLAVCGSSTIRIDPHGVRLRYGNLRPRTVRRSWAWVPSPLGHATVMIRTEIARNNPYSETAAYCEDYELFLRLTHAGHELRVLPEPLVLSRVHDDSITGKHRQEQLANTYRVFRQYHPDANVTAAEFEILIGARIGGMGLRRRLRLMRDICRPDPLPPFLVAFALRLAFRGRQLESRPLGSGEA